MAKQIDRSLSASYFEYAERIQKGRGFWDGNRITNDPAKCRDKRKELIELGNMHARNQ